MVAEGGGIARKGMLSVVGVVMDAQPARSSHLHQTKVELFSGYTLNFPS